METLTFFATCAAAADVGAGADSNGGAPVKNVVSGGGSASG